MTDKNQQFTILADDVEVYAKLNYLRDAAFDVLDEDQTWKNMRTEYIHEANEVQEYILSHDDVDAIIEKLER